MDSFYKAYAQHYFTDVYMHVPHGKHWRKMPVTGRPGSIVMRTPNHHGCTKRLLYTRTYDIESHDEIRNARHVFDVQKAEAILDSHQRALDSCILDARIIANKWGACMPERVLLPDEIDINHPALRSCWHVVREADVFEVSNQRKPRKVYKGGHHSPSHERDDWTVSPYNRTHSKRDAKKDICQGIEDCEDMEIDRLTDEYHAWHDGYYEDEWEEELAFRTRTDIKNAMMDMRRHGYENTVAYALTAWAHKQQPTMRERIIALA